MPIYMTLTETPVDPSHQDGAGNGDVPADAQDAGDRALERSYSRLFRDAFGRVLAREKRDLKAIQGAFGPVLFSIADTLAIELKHKAGAETQGFVAEDMGAMQKRAETWPRDPGDAQLALLDDGLASDELSRAIRALRIAVAREAATAKAKIQ